MDSLEGDVVASADYLRVQNATAAQGPLRAQFQGSVGLSQWKTGDTSPIAGTATLKECRASPTSPRCCNARDLPVTGTLNGSAQVNGTIAAPRAQADLELLKGTLRDEPFDRFTAHAGYAANTLTVSQRPTDCREETGSVERQPFSTSPTISIPAACAST